MNYEGIRVSFKQGGPYQAAYFVLFMIFERKTCFCTIYFLKRLRLRVDRVAAAVEWGR